MFTLYPKSSHILQNLRSKQPHHHTNNITTPKKKNPFKFLKFHTTIKFIFKINNFPLIFTFSISLLLFWTPQLINIIKFNLSHSLHSPIFKKKKMISLFWAPTNIYLKIQDFQLHYILLYFHQPN